MAEEALFHKQTVDGGRVKVDGGLAEQLQGLSERTDGWPSNEGESDGEGLDSQKKEKQEIMI